MADSMVCSGCQPGAGPPWDPFVPCPAHLYYTGFPREILHRLIILFCRTASAAVFRRPDSVRSGPEGNQAPRVVYYLFEIIVP